MAGQRTVTKPSRSDEVLGADEQLKIADQIRAQFESAAPKRPMKPNRSEPDSFSSATPNPVDYSSVDQPSIPELDKFRSLQTQPLVILSTEGASMAQEEFVDTKYYKELNSIDKEHHMTGSGFIRLAREDGGEFDGFDFQSPQSHSHEGIGVVVRTGTGIRSNPATNDWIPRNGEDEEA